MDAPDFDPPSEAEEDRAVGHADVAAPPDPVVDDEASPDVGLKRRIPKQPLSYDMPDIAQWWMSRDVIIPLELVTFDYRGDLGQARPLNIDLATTRVEAIKKNPLDEILQVKLWEDRAGSFCCSVSSNFCHIWK